MNILIVKLSAIGDVIHTLPALNALRKHYPEAHITWLTEEAAYPLIEGHHALNRILLSRRKQWIKGIRGASRSRSLKEAYLFIKELRDTRYDLIIDFQQLLKSSVPVALARGRRKIGYGRGMEHQEHSYVFLNERIPAVSMEIHALTRNMLLLKSLGIKADEIVFDIPVQAHDRHLTDELLSQHEIKPSEPLIAVNPVAKWETKLWSEKKFSELADRLTEIYSVRVIFTGGPEDRDTVEEIIAGMRHRAVNLAGETNLKMLAALYEKTACLISTDTGPMHLAAAMGTGVVALFGPTAPWRTGPFGSGHQIIRAGLECSPCFKRRCRTVECMARIGVADVLEGIRKMAGIKKV